MIYKNTFGTEQIDTTIITSSSGKKIYIWKSIFEGVATLNFLTSEIVMYQNVEAHLRYDPHLEGAADEVLSLSCDAGTTVTVLYEEL